MGVLGFLKRKYSLSDGVLQGSTDSHSHILFGLDDGIKTLEDSLNVLAFLESLGINRLWCTPHVMDDLATPTEVLKARFEELKQAYSGTIELHLAAEYMLDGEFEKRLLHDDLLVMDDNQILVETSMNIAPNNLMEILSEIMSKGYRPLLAHPERYRYMSMSDYEYLDSIGVYLQLNLPSIVGYYGETAQQKAKLLLKKGLYKRFGSDCQRLSAIQSQYTRKALTKEINEQLTKLL